MSYGLLRLLITCLTFTGIAVAFSSCGLLANSSGVYTATADVNVCDYITASYLTCVNVTADDVVIDLQGHTMNLSCYADGLNLDMVMGLYSDGNDNVTIRNGAIVNLAGSTMKIDNVPIAVYYLNGVNVYVRNMSILLEGVQGRNTVLFERTNHSGSINNTYVISGDFGFGTLENDYGEYYAATNNVITVNGIGCSTYVETDSCSTTWASNVVSAGACDEPILLGLSCAPSSSSTQYINRSEAPGYTAIVFVRGVAQLGARALDAVLNPDQGLVGILAMGLVFFALAFAGMHAKIASHSRP